jgi:hypothetical protein
MLTRHTEASIDGTNEVAYDQPTASSATEEDGNGKGRVGVRDCLPGS